MVDLSVFPGGRGGALHSAVGRFGETGYVTHPVNDNVINCLLSFHLNP